ncbi:MAG: hypothetical protein J6Y85_03220 [Alphaproteobacteria bacterium]|nr:hypothetical protein [Alphaproteobacteria bacterium]
MQKKLEKLTTQLIALSDCAENPTLLFEEMQKIQEKAFKVQDELMQLLEEMENDTTDITQLQNIFQIRENVWDIMSKLADKEQEIKATKNKKAPAEKKEKCHCGCQHVHHEGCCCHKEKGNCKKEGKTCKKK